MNIPSCLCDETLITSVKSFTVRRCSYIEQMLKQFCQQSTPQKRKKSTNKCAKCLSDIQQESVERLHHTLYSQKVSLYSRKTASKLPRAEVIHRALMKTRHHDLASHQHTYAYTHGSAHKHTNTQPLFSITMLEELHSKHTI